MTASLVKVDRVERVFPQGGKLFHALRGVSLEVWPGEMVVVSGPSGSGKSTLLHIIAGLDAPSAGSVALSGTPLSSMSDDQVTLYRRRNIGIIFQFFHLLPGLDASSNVALPLILDGRPGAEVAESAREALHAVGLGSLGSRLPRELSGGERQRVAIARALVMKPKLVLADEPTGNLDTASGSEVIRLLEGIPREHGAAVVLVTHQPEAAPASARRLGMRDGVLSPG